MTGYERTEIYMICFFHQRARYSEFCIFRHVSVWRTEKCLIQSFSSPPTSLENLCDNSLTVCFSRTNMVAFVIIFSISFRLFLILSLRLGDDDGDDNDGDDNDGDDIIILITLIYQKIY